MGKTTPQDVERRKAMDLYQAEAARNALAAFSEGYMMGVHHAEQIYEKGVDENQSK